MSNTLLPNLVEDKTLVWNLVLLNMNYVPIAVIQYENLSFTRKFNDYDELNFTVPRFLYDRYNKSTIDNNTWFTLKAGLIVRLEVFEQTGLVWAPIFQELFSIQQPSLSESRDNNSQQWSCIALHQLLFNKVKIRGYDDTRKLVEPNKPGENDVTALTATPENPYRPICHTENSEGTYEFKDNTKGGILDYALDYIIPDWSIAYYDPALLDIAQQGKIDDAWMNNAIAGVIDVWVDGNDPTVTVDEEYLVDTNEMCDGYEDLIRDHVRGTKENILLMLAEYQQYLIDIQPFDSVAHIRTALNDVVTSAEPLKGAQLIAKAENAIVVIQNWMRTLCDYTYDDIGYTMLYGTSNSDTTGILYRYKEVCRSILNNFIEQLSRLKSATGSVPYRTLKLDTTLVDMFKQLEENYLCVFSFDNINKQIYIYGRQNTAIDSTKGMVISPDNIMTNISYQANTDQVVTRLYAKGKDDIALGGYNITGLNYVDNFDYYAENGQMSQELQQALKYYKWLLEDVKLYQDMINSGELDTYMIITAYQDKVRAMHDDTDWVLSKNATWLHENFLVPAAYYTGEYLNITDYTGGLPDHISYWTIKQLQEKIAKMSGDTVAAQALARQWEIVSWSEEPTDAEKGSEDSWWNNSTSLSSPSYISERSAVNDAVTNSLKEIQKEISIYLTKDIEQYNDSVLNNMGEIWMLLTTGNPDIRNNNFYLYCNVEIELPNSLTSWQKQFQYENLHYGLDSTQPAVFNSTLLTELKNFVYEEDIMWSTITSADALVLYAAEYLDYLRKIPITIDIDTIDILSNYRYQFDWSKITDVGAHLYIDFVDYDLKYDLFKLMNFSYSLSPTDRQLKIQLSNTYEIQDALNQVINDIWAYSYKQLQDISEYKTSWENFIAKEDALMLQGQQIQADVSAIVDNAGNKVVGSKGLVISPVKYNGLMRTPNGYYVRDKTYTTTATATPASAMTVSADKKVTPDHIVFKNGDLKYATDNYGETTLYVDGLGGAGGSGLPWLYAVPMLSEKIKARLVGNTSWHVTRDNNTYVYYQEMKDNTYTWYEQQIDLTEANIISATDESGNVLYWSDNNRAVSYSGTTAVQIYAAIGAPKVVFQAYRSNTAGSEHLPIFKFGVGDGEGHGYGYLEKTTDGIKVSYYTRTGGTAPDTENRYRGIYIKDNGIYQIRGSQECYVPFVHIQSTLQDSTDIEENDWVLVDAGV